MTIAQRAQHAANVLREQNLVPSTRLHEVSALIAAALEMTEAAATEAPLKALCDRLRKAEDVCYALETQENRFLININVKQKLNAWRSAK